MRKTNNTLNKRDNHIFKPLVASSLALALGVSVAVATDPTITYDNDGNAPESTILANGWNWKNDATSTEGSGSFLTPQQSSSSTITNLSFVFDKLTDPSNTPTQTITSSGSVNTLTIKADGNVSGNSAILTFSNASTGKGLLLGTGTADADRGTLTFNFLGSDQTSNSNWNFIDGTHTRKMVLDLTDTTSYTPTAGGDAQSVSLIGNILIKAGMDINHDNTDSSIRPNYRNRVNTNVFEATFGGDMIGNITIDTSDINDPNVPNLDASGKDGSSKFRDIQSTFTFTSGSLSGNILGNTGVNTFNFQGSNVGITGSITAHNGYDKTNTSAGSVNQFYGAINKINFTGSGTATITGDILAKEAGQNIIVFGSGTEGKILGNIQSGVKTPDIVTVNVNHNNSIVFNGASGQIGSSEAKKTMKVINRINDRQTVLYRSSNNNILFNAQSNSLYLSELSTNGDFDTNLQRGTFRRTFNLLDFSGTNNTAQIDTINSYRGMSIIGKGLIKDVATAGYTTQLDSNSLYYNDAIFSKNLITFTPNTSGTKFYAIQFKDNALTEFAKDIHTASGTYTLGGISAASGNSANYINVQNLNVTGDISATTDGYAMQGGGTSGKNYIFANGESSITGNILSSLKDSPSAMNGYNNLLVLRGTSAALGGDSKAISIKVDNNEGRNHSRYSNNTILLDATTTSLNVSELSTTANWAVSGDKAKNFNALSFNNSTNNGSKNITTISSTYGSNIIGKDLVTFNSNSGVLSYDSALFGNNTSIQDNFATNFMTDKYTAKGSFALGTITANDNGTNYINVENLTISTSLNASSGNNYIYAGLTTGTNSENIISGTIAASSGTNNISFSGTSSTNTISGAISTSGGTNNLVFLGTSSTNTISGAISAGNGTNNITFSGSGSTNTISNNISVNGNGSNAISFAESLSIVGSSAITLTAEWGQNNITSSNGSNITLGSETYKVALKAYGNAATNVAQNNISTTGSITAHLSTISTSNSNNNGNGYHKNIITGGANSNITIASMSASDHANNINQISVGANSSILVTGNITSSTGKNNFVFTGNNSILTLQGTTSQITNLTAYAPSSRSANISTLVIDGSTQTNNTTIDNVINGSNLIAKFNGNGTDKGATLKISAFAGGNNTLKAITLGDASTNNTLDLTTLGNTTITDAINVGEDQGLNINLKNTTLTTSGWSNAGTSTITVGGASIDSANSTLQGGNVTLSGLILQATNGASMTLQNSSTTIGTLTSSSTNGDKLILGFDSPDITTQTNPVSATITGQVSGNNLTLVFNGGEDRSTSLTLSGTDKTFKAIQLGSNGTEQSTHNTLILNGGKTTITDKINVGGTNTQEIEFSLANGTDLELTGGLATGDNGITTLDVVAGASATLSGSNTIGLTNLNMGLGTSASSLTFKNATTIIDTLTSNATDSIVNTLIMGDGSSIVSINDTAKNTKFDLVFNANTNTQAKTFTLTGGENTIQNVSVDANDTSTANTLAVTGGSTTIDTITIASGKNLTLALSSDRDVASSTLVTVNSQIDGANVSFSGGINPADQIHNATLWLKGQNNTIASIESSASNGVILFENTAGATIGSATITSVTSTPSVTDPSAPSTLLTPSTGGSLTFAFRGAGASNVAINGGGITVGNGATLGISLGVTDATMQTVSGNITFQEGSTLLVDFLDGNKGNATLGSNGAFTINSGSYSIINFHGSNEGQINNGGITIAGGNNTVNFIGSSRMKGLILNSGTNTINVYGKSSTGKEIVGEIVTSEVGSVTNTINLNDYSTLKLLSSDSDKEGSGTLTSTANSNTLNFLGEGAKLQGGFGADGGTGTATINVGTDSTKTGISGLITGNVSGASIVFKGTLANEDSSKLTLQGANNTISSLTTSSTNGILVLDAKKNAVSVDVNNAGGMTIGSGKSITIALHSEGTNNATFNVTNGSITVDGTLGIAISGDGEGTRTISASSGNITFNSGSTLRVDFLENSAGSAEFVGANLTISSGRKSEINFYAGSTAILEGGGLLIQDGGTNTVNFYGNAKLAQVAFEGGTNNINVFDNVKATVDIASVTDDADPKKTYKIGNATNTIDLKEGATLVVVDGTTPNASILSSGKNNTLIFSGANATLQGGFGLDSGASGVTATINVKNTGAKITGNVTNAGVSFSGVSGSTLTLQGVTNTLNTLSSTTNITGTIILDTTLNNSVSAEITSAVASNSSVGLKFGAGAREKTFTFSETGNNLSGVAFDENGSTNNKIAFTKGSNTITNAFAITQGQGLTIALGDENTNSSFSTDINANTQISLALTGGFSQEGGNANLRVEGANTADALISGGEIDVGNLDMVASTSASLTLKNSSITIGTLTAQSASNTLKLDATSNAVNTTISNTLNGSNLTITLAGVDATKTATLNLNGANNTISNLTLEASSTNNTLALNKGKTTISNGASVDASQGISFNLASGTTLEFGGSNTFTNSGNATFDIQGANATLNGVIKASGGTTTLSMSEGSSLTLTNGLSTTDGNTAINFAGVSSITGDITTDNSSTDTTTTIKLVNGSNASISGDITTTGTNANTTINYSAGNASLTLKNGDQTISTLTLASNATNTLNLSNQANTTINNALTLGDSTNFNVNIDGNSSLNLASVSTTSGALNVNTDGFLSGSLTLAGLTNETTAVNNIINVSTLNLNGNLSVNQWATNTIKANSITISGNVISKNQGGGGSEMKNIIITNSLEFASSSSVYAGHTGGRTSKNLFDISGDTQFSNKTLTIIANNNFNDETAERYKQNIFKFGGKVEGAMAELTATVISDDVNTHNTANILSFEGSNSQSLTITDINKADTIANQFANDTDAKKYTNGKSGNIYIGKNLTSGSGETLAFNSAFNDTNWSDATYQASNLTLTIQNLNTNGGKNYINVGTLNVGNDSGSGSISASGGGVNNIALGKDSKIKGNITSSGGANNIVIQGSGATLTLEGKDADGTAHAITTLNASGENTTLVLDNSGVTTGAMTTTINTLENGANLTATLKGSGSGKEATLILSGGALKALTLGDGSTGNILDLSNATAEMSITNQVNVGKDQDLTIKLKNTTLALNSGLNTNGGTSTLELVGDTNNASNATLTGGAVALSNLTLGATNSNKLTISSSSAVIDRITASGSTSNTLALNNTHTTITSAINVTDKPLSFEVNNSTLIFGSSTNTITSLTSNGGLVDLSQGVKPQTSYAMARGAVLASNGASARNTLTMQTLEGTATFKLYASKTESDRVEFGSTQPAPYDADTSIQPTTPSGVAIISITGGNDVFSITESDNVVVATRADNSVEVVGGESYIGGAKVGVTIGAKEGDVNTFIIKNTREIEADPVYQEVASSALAVNYDLYLANFNSLNKRMGELRNSEDSNGVWARVFGGAMSNDFGAGSRTQYLTAQAGYDYSLSVGDNARNFIGIAVAYGTSDTKGNASYASSSNNAGLSLDKVSSNMVEVGLYNSYVADNGWYNDTIFKFDYIMSDFSLSNDPNTMSSTSNFAMVLSDEFGYRYSFGVSEKGSWYIDPQAEFAFGYFNQSDFNRAVDSLTNIKASQDAILTLRSRIGATLGKKFNTEKGFASLYVGASYEYDYIEGGSSGVSTRDGGLITQLDKVESNGRAILNVGSNIELTKGARLYIDVEKSFGDKQRTFMQFNLGARYSF